VSHLFRAGYREGVPAFYCPHCCLTVGASAAASFPPQAIRCTSCRLLVGAGRATREPSEAISSGSAAGTLVSAARRADVPPVDPAVAVADLRHAAALNGCEPQYLRMLDYEAAARLGDVETSLSQVIATFRSWKSARAAAAVGAPSLAAH
jgi:hypothetical protein